MIPKISRMVAWGAFRSTLQQTKADENDGNNKHKKLRDFPGGPVVKIQHFHSRGAQVPSPAGELRSCKPSTEQQKKKKENYKAKFWKCPKDISAKELMSSNCGAGEDSWESLKQQGDPTSQYQRKSTLNIPWKDWYWSWSSNTLATWWDEPTHWKKPWRWERLRVRGEEEGRGWDG